MTNSPLQTSSPKRRRLSLQWLLAILGSCLAAESLQFILLQFQFKAANNTFGADAIYNSLEASTKSLGQYIVVVALIPIVFMFCLLCLLHSINRSVLFIVSILAILGECAVTVLLVSRWLNWKNQPA